MTFAGSKLSCSESQNPQWVSPEAAAGGLWFWGQFSLQGPWVRGEVTLASRRRPSLSRMKTALTV